MVRKRRPERIGPYGWGRWPSEDAITQHGRQFGHWLARPPAQSPDGLLVLGRFEQTASLGWTFIYEGGRALAQELADRWTFCPIDAWGRPAKLGVRR